MPVTDPRRSTMRIFLTSGRAWFVKKQRLFRTRALYAHLRGNKTSFSYNQAGVFRTASIKSPINATTSLTNGHFSTVAHPAN